MNILLVHNSYQQPGGEDRVFQMEAALLREYAHDVHLFQSHNDEVSNRGRAALFAQTIWNAESHRQIRQKIRDLRIELVHVHNTFPLISPSVYYAAASERVPVVQTLHNYRFLCPAATFYRNQKICEDCMGKRVTWPAVAHSCYRQSKAASFASTALLAVHGSIGTWKHKVAAYIALTEFARAKFIEGGFPAEKIAVKPNFVDPDPGPGRNDPGDYALFMGRLTPEKGVRTVLEAWRLLDGTIPLRIAGSGPLLDEVRASATTIPGVELQGWMSREQLLDTIRNAAFVIVPSEWYEPFGLTVVEAFASSVPVIASRLGSLESTVKDGKNGLLFEAGNAANLAAKVRMMRTMPNMLAAMRKEARLEYESRYTSKRNYELLMEIYEAARRAVAAGTERLEFALDAAKRT